MQSKEIYIHSCYPLIRRKASRYAITVGIQKVMNRI